MSDVPTASIDQLTWDRVREYQRVIEALSRIGPQALTPQQLMQHVTAQVSRATMISRTKVLRYRPEKGDLLVEAGVGWKPGVVGKATLAVDYRSPAGRAFQTGAPVTIEDTARAYPALDAASVLAPFTQQRPVCCSIVRLRSPSKNGLRTSGKPRPSFS